MSSRYDPGEVSPAFDWLSEGSARKSCPRRIQALTSVFFGPHFPGGGQTNKYTTVCQGGLRMFVWIPSRVKQWLRSACIRVCVCVCLCGECFCLSALREAGEAGGGGESLEFCFRHRSVPEACRLQLAVVTTSKLCRKIATVGGKLHFPACRDCR